jgi:hypothetical protein
VGTQATDLGMNYPLCGSDQMAGTGPPLPFMSNLFCGKGLPAVPLEHVAHPSLLSASPQHV